MKRKKPLYLGEVAQGRDNNFNLLRMAAALSVLVSHSYPLSLGIKGEYEPVALLLGISLGTIGVDLFFIISGFLVTASLFNRKHAVDFFWARMLRVYPALWLVVLLSAFALGPLFTALPLREYLTHPGLYDYLAKCTTLVDGVAYKLPGVFKHNPFGMAVNGSLWTLPFEVKMYGILLAGWLVCLLAGPWRKKIFQVAVVCAVLVTFGLIVFGGFYQHNQTHFTRLFFLFFSGSAYYILRHRIRLSGLGFTAIILGLAASLLINHTLFVDLYVATIPYVWLYLAYVPGGFIRKYNQLGDYSYGVYIYAFVVQQTVSALIPGIGPWAMSALAIPVTLFWAVLSWKLVERRALAFKGPVSARTHSLFAIRRRLFQRA